MLMSFSSLSCFNRINKALNLCLEILMNCFSASELKFIPGKIKMMRVDNSAN